MRISQINNQNYKPNFASTKITPKELEGLKDTMNTLILDKNILNETYKPIIKQPIEKLRKPVEKIVGLLF